MHEFSTATSLVETILEHLAKEDVEKVLEVSLIVGKLTLLGTEQLEFCYGIVTKGTIMEGSKLSIEEVDVQVVCPNCKYQGPAKFENDLLHFVPIATLQCPECASRVKILGGNECKIKNVKCQRRKQNVSVSK